MAIRGLNFSADGPVDIYSGHDGYNDEKLLLRYTQEMRVVHINAVPGAMSGIYPTVYPTVRITSRNRKEVHFIVDYDPR